MMSSTMKKIKAARQRQLATRDLAYALAHGNLEQMVKALESGANPDKVSMEFDMPMMHFRETYEVCGAVDVALHQQLPTAFFEALFMAGASLGRDFQKEAGPSASWVHQQGLLELYYACQQRLSLDQDTRAVPGIGRPRHRL